jgi:hypothetical protein
MEGYGFTRAINNIATDDFSRWVRLSFPLDFLCFSGLREGLDRQTTPKRKLVQALNPELATRFGV